MWGRLGDPGQTWQLERHPLGSHSGGWEAIEGYWDMMVARPDLCLGTLPLAERKGGNR